MGGQANGVVQGLPRFPVVQFFRVQGVILKAQFKMQMRWAVAYGGSASCSNAIACLYILVGRDPDVIQMGVIRFHAIGVANDDEFAVSAGVVLRVPNPPFVDAEDRISHLQGDVQALVQLAATGPEGRHDGARVRFVKRGRLVEIQTDFKGVPFLNGLADEGE